jgi:DnaJ-class molecular chaperone
MSDDDDTETPCPWCAGTGKVFATQDSIPAVVAPEPIEIKCPDCGGSGRMKRTDAESQENPGWRGPGVSLFLF